MAMLILCLCTPGSHVVCIGMTLWKGGSHNFGKNVGKRITVTPPNWIPYCALFDFRFPLSLCCPLFDSLWLISIRDTTDVDVKYASCRLQYLCHSYKKFSCCWDSYVSNSEQEQGTHMLRLLADRGSPREYKGNIERNASELFLNILSRNSEESLSVRLMFFSFHRKCNLSYAFPHIRFLDCMEVQLNITIINSLSLKYNIVCVYCHSISRSLESHWRFRDHRV
jgi:hypothetical protein